MTPKLKLAFWFTLRHAAFWLLIWLSLAAYFASSPWSLHAIDWWYATFFLPGLMAMVYLNRALLIPFFLKRKYPVLVFIVLAQVSVGVGNRIHWFVQVILGESLLDQYFFGEYDWIASVFVCTIVLVIYLALHFTRAWFIQREKMQEIQSSRLESEVRLLRSQLEPHFLFNSLNTIYALSLRQDERTPEAVLELSQLLRYVQLASGKNMVNLQEEWDFLEKYKNIQALRLGEKVQINFEAKGRLAEQEIAPLILINPVENAFKHLARNPDGSARIDVHLDLHGDELRFFVQNTCKKAEKSHPSSTGIRHLEKQLKIHYPNRHRLEIKPGIDVFLCELTLNLHP